MNVTLVVLLFAAVHEPDVVDVVIVPKFTVPVDAETPVGTVLLLAFTLHVKAILWIFLVDDENVNVLPQ